MERDGGATNNKQQQEMNKVDIPAEVEAALMPALLAAGGGGGGGGLARQGSISKNNSCLCSPTTHAGSFRCRLHRAPSLQRTKSIESTTIQEDSPQSKST